MGANFKKILYDNRQGVSLHHTAGAQAGDSTLGFAHRHFANMLIYFIRGSGNIKIEGRQYDIRQGDMILLNPTELFLCKVDSNMYHERIVLYINDSFPGNFPCPPEDLLAPFTVRPKGVGNRICAQAVQANGLDALLSALLDLFRSPTPTNNLLSVCKVAELLVQLRQAMVPSHYEGISKHSNPLIEDVLAYINAHYQQDISLSSIADSFSFHKSYLSHLFTDQVGMPLWTYVILRRLNAFDELVRRGSSIEEACHQVGFQNYSNFFRLYKKHTGMTPMQFKKQLLEQ